MSSIIVFLTLITCIHGYLGSSSGSMVFHKNSIINGGVGIVAENARVSKLYSDVSAQTNESTKISSQQEMTDRYLEFLDRRYHRNYNNDEDKDDTIQMNFSLLDWLRQSPNSSTDTKKRAKMKKNALYILGVADLASKKLRLKYKQDGGAFYNFLRDGYQNKDKSKLIAEDDGISSSNPFDYTSNPVQKKVAILQKIKSRKRFSVQNAMHALAICLILL